MKAEINITPVTAQNGSSRIVRNSAYNAGRLIIVSCAGIVTSSMIARLLGPEGMGNYSYAVWVSALLLSAAHGGVPTAMTRYIAETLARRRWYALKRVFARLLVWQIAVVLVVCLTALLILRLTHPERPVLYLIAIAIVLPQVLHEAVTGAMTGLQRFDRIATVSVISATLNVGAVVIAASLRVVRRSFAVCVSCHQSFGNLWIAAPQQHVPWDE